MDYNYKVYIIYGCTQKADPVLRSQRSQFVQMLTSLNVSLGAYPSHRSESPLLADIVNEPSVTRQSIYHITRYSIER